MQSNKSREEFLFGNSHSEALNHWVSPNKRFRVTLACTKLSIIPCLDITMGTRNVTLGGFVSAEDPQKSIARVYIMRKRGSKVKHYGHKGFLNALHRQGFSHECQPGLK